MPSSVSAPFAAVSTLRCIAPVGNRLLACSPTDRLLCEAIWANCHPMGLLCCFSGGTDGRQNAYAIPAEAGSSVDNRTCAASIVARAPVPPTTQPEQQDNAADTPNTGRLSLVAVDPAMRRVQDSAFRESPSHSQATSPTAQQSDGRGQSSSDLEGAQRSSSLSQAVQTGAANMQMTTPALLLRDIDLQEFIGAGAYASVFRGSWQCANAAIKLLVTESLDTVSLKEAIISPQLSHPNVVQTFTSRCSLVDQASLDRLSADLQQTDSNDSHSPSHNSGSRDFMSGEGFGAPPERASSYGNPLLWAMRCMSAKPNQYVTVIVMEHCDKGTLHSAIYKGVFHPSSNWGAHTAKRALLRSLQEITRGMVHLHESGVMHGDLKPANVLLKSARHDKRGFTAKIADFGLCKLMDGLDSSSASMTWGTVSYMAPERFQKQMTCAADVYSFGVMLSEMMNRERPFKEYRHAQVVMGVMQGELKPSFPTAHPDLAEIGQRCIALNPEDRPTFRELEMTFVELEREMRRELKGQQGFSPLSSYNSMESPNASLGVRTGSPTAPFPVSQEGVTEKRVSRLGL